MMNDQSIHNKNLFLLHFVILIFGFTAILGKLITIPAENLVWYRMLIASIGIAIYLKFKGKPASLSKKNLFQYLGVGVIIAAHWFTFFQAIKISNVSITLVSLSVTSLFVALLQPLFFKQKLVFYEVVLGLFTIVGIALIFNVEKRYSNGILMGLLSALLAALFSLTNTRLVKKNEATLISLYEMLGGVLVFTVYFLFTGKFTAGFFQVSMLDWLWLLILGLICTSFAYVATVHVLKVLSPFTASIAINLEPIYGIILAILIFKDTEKMQPSFYIGAAIILSAIVLNSVLKKRALRRAK
jgi:drug/metabolite transporter (DMT)-like permease